MPDNFTVHHRHFGEGAALQALYTGGSVSEVVTVDFGAHGVKRVLVASTAWIDRDAVENAFDRLSEVQARPRRVRKADEAA